jgi:hypothetical protein
MSDETLARDVNKVLNPVSTPKKFPPVAEKLPGFFFGQFWRNG